MSLSCPYTRHYDLQAGGELPFYTGALVQKGYGLGGIFRSMGRYALPFLTKAARYIGKRAIATGARVASDVAAGGNLKKVTKARLREATRDIAEDVGRRLQQSGSGRRKRKRAPARKKKGTKKRRKTTRVARF